MKANTLGIKFPIHDIFYYDGYAGEWILTDRGKEVSTPRIGEDVSVFFKENKSEDSEWIIWCPKHQRYEHPGKGGTKKHCRAKGSCLFFFKPPKVDPLMWCSGVWRWQIRLDSPEADLQIITDYAAVNCKKKFIWSRLQSELVPYIQVASQCSYRANLSQKQVPGYSCPDWMKPDTFPDEIAKRVTEILKYAMPEVHNKNIFIPKFLDYCGTQSSDLEHIVKHPYDIQISYLRRFVGDDFFEDEITSDGAKNYERLCSYLGIHPPASIRKEYMADPYALIMYMWLSKLGFKDINAIRLFLVPPIMDKIRFKSVEFDPERHLIRGFRLPCTHSGMDFVFYVRWMLKNGKEEMPLAKQIVQALSGKWERWQDDMLRMFHEYYPFLSEDTKKLVKRRGISEASHDALVHESFGIELKKSTISYQSPKIHALNSVVGGFEFHVVTDTRELPIIGRKLSNCVASYVDRMLRQQCLIVAASSGNAYQACIELGIAEKDSNGLVERMAVYQCLGRFNRLLKDKAQAACIAWVRQNGLEMRCDDLPLAG